MVNQISIHSVGPADVRIALVGHHFQRATTGFIAGYQPRTTPPPRHQPQ